MRDLWKAIARGKGYGIKHRINKEVHLRPEGEINNIDLKYIGWYQCPYCWVRAIYVLTCYCSNCGENIVWSIVKGRPIII